MTTAPIAANDNVRQFYVYQHRRNDTGAVFYIGKGNNRRAWATDKRGAHWRSIVKKHGYTVDVICDELDEDFAFLLEEELIAKIGRRDIRTGPLVNMTSGGEGRCGSIIGEETRAKLSAAGAGRVFSEETRAKISASNTGKTMSADAVSKMRAAKLGGFLSDAHKAKIGNSLKGRVVSEKTRRKIGASNRGKTRSPEARANISAGKLGRRQTRESVDIRSTSLRMCGPRSDNTSGYKGVSLVRRTGNWASYITLGKHVHLGAFETKEDAARAYDAAAIAAWGAGNCYLNFPAEHVLAA